MKCYNHEEASAVGTCVSCGKAICDDCTVRVQDKLVCRECLAAGKTGSQGPSDITDNDKMMGLLSYVITLIVPLIILLSESGKQRRFQRYHAVHSLILSGVIIVVSLLLWCTIGLILELLTAGLATCCLLPISFIPYVLTIYYGIQAYQGKYAEIPVITDFARGQGWV